MLSQMEIVGAVLAELERQGMGRLLPRQLNAVINGVNEMLSELNRAEVAPKNGCGLSAWLSSDCTGQSSIYMAHVLQNSTGKYAIPYDGADFGRCVGLIDAVPEFRAKIVLLSDPKHGIVWNRIAENWDSMETWYRADLPTGSSQRLYHLLAKFREEASATGENLP